MSMDIIVTAVPVRLSSDACADETATPCGSILVLQQVFAHVMGAAILLTSNSISNRRYLSVCLNMMSVRIENIHLSGD